MTWFVEKYADAYLAPTREIFDKRYNRASRRIASTSPVALCAASFTGTVPIATRNR